VVKYWQLRQEHRSISSSFLQSLLPGLLLFAQAAGAEKADVDYNSRIQPIFDRYCVACHACFDAPCQLNLASATGVTRGASKAAVYDANRLEPAQPTRLFIDARDETSWRQLGFFDVTHPAQASVLQQLLELHHEQPLKPARPVPEEIDISLQRSNQCLTRDELNELDGDMPHIGMPFALPQISSTERETLLGWLQQGAPVAQVTPVVTAAEQQQIERWETWLNRDDARQSLVARWLYEHLVFAHLYFNDGNSGHFFRLVRSRTAPGEAVQEIASRLPNEDPGGRFYYRLRRLQGSLVYKTHITFALRDGLLEKLQQDFLDSDWQVQTLPGYSDAERGNPFATFAAIPARARYRFMLEHAEYFVRSFIRGPVCRGQLATDVIRDHFWVMFQHPDADAYVIDPDYRKSVTALLDLPNVEEDLFGGAQAWLASIKNTNKYQDLRGRKLSALDPHGATLESIWHGGGTDQNALLTVFRHHDSATVKRGWLGQHPLTLWWLDYPLFEQSYYNLVVNFDVFGNLAHQAQTRLYFDLIRNSAEQNFLRLLPADKRQQYLDNWYRGSGKLKLWFSYQAVDDKTPTAVPYKTEQVYAELLARLLQQFTAINATLDPINRPVAATNNRLDRLLSQLTTASAEQMPAIAHLPDASLLHIVQADGQRRVYTLIRNRRHSNVAFILGESLRYEPEKDSLSIVPGIASSYPNFIFRIPSDQLEAFVATLRDSRLADAKRFRHLLVDRWGVRRSDPRIWDELQDIQAYLRETDSVNAAILDIYRYANL
jgi:hypothetical protein